MCVCVCGGGGGGGGDNKHNKPCLIKTMITTNLHSKINLLLNNYASYVRGRQKETLRKLLRTLVCYYQALQNSAPS